VAELALEDGYRALREAAGVVATNRDVVRVGGPDAAQYLQGQTSQDLLALPAGAATWALVLQPQGKLDAFVRAYRASGDELILVTDAGVGNKLVARLERFKLRTRVEIGLLGCPTVAVLGPSAGQALAGAPVAGTVVAFEWGGLEGYELLGTAAGDVAALRAAGVPSVSHEAYEAVRVEAGFPRHGSELDERTVPAEAGLVSASVSFTKGCYTGQELVARIDSRGSNVPRRLRGLLLSGPAGPGAALVGPKGVVGRLTSVAFSPRLGWVALGYVGRGVEVSSELAVEGDEAVEATVRELPLTGS